MLFAVIGLYPQREAQEFLTHTTSPIKRQKTYEQLKTMVMESLFITVQIHEIKNSSSVVGTVVVVPGLFSGLS